MRLLCLFSNNKPPYRRSAREAGVQRFSRDCHQPTQSTLRFAGAQFRTQLTAQLGISMYIKQQIQRCSPCCCFSPAPHTLQYFNIIKPDDRQRPNWLLLPCASLSLRSPNSNSTQPVCSCCYIDGTAGLWISELAAIKHGARSRL